VEEIQNKEMENAQKLAAILHKQSKPKAKTPTQGL